MRLVFNRQTTLHLTLSSSSTIELIAIGFLCQTVLDAKCWQCPLSHRPTQCCWL